MGQTREKIFINNSQEQLFIIIKSKYEGEQHAKVSIITWVLVQEKDLSNVVPAVATTTVGGL